MNQSTIIPIGDRAAVRELLSRIRAHRLARNWSQAEMAKRCGLSRATYQNLEGGFGNPTLQNLMRVLGILGYSARVADLLPELEPEQTLASLQKLPATRERARARSTNPPTTP